MSLRVLNAFGVGNSVDVTAAMLYAVNNGADLNAVKDLLGHESLSATQIYTHNSIEKLKNIFEQAHPKA